MNRGFGFILAVPIFFIMVFASLQFQYVNEEQQAFEEYVLVQQVDYATDAAAAELLEQAHIGTDYQDWGRINTDPDVALRAFESVMLVNYDFPLTEKSYDMISSNYLPLFCVAGYDGYYVYELMPNNESVPGWYLRGSHKFPYSYQGTAPDDEGNLTDAYYALNLGLDNCRQLVAGTYAIKSLEECKISKDRALFEINSRVSDDLTYRLQEYETKRGEDERDVLEYREVYFPAKLTTMSQVNAIQGPTVIAMVDQWDIDTTHAISAFSIGGAKLEPSRMVAGYVSNGIKYYAYSDLLPEDEIGPDKELDITELFSSVDEAAAAGYHYDTLYMNGTN